MEVFGNNVIDEEVFAELARASLQKVNEVYVQEKKGAIAELATLITEKFAPQIIIKKNDIDTQEETVGKVSYEIKLTLIYGINIPEALKKVREIIASEVENITGYEVERIDLFVEKIVRQEQPV